MREKGGEFPTTRGRDGLNDSVIRRGRHKSRFKLFLRCNIMKAFLKNERNGEKAHDKKTLPPCS